ncbi:hypothetical protein E3J38_05025, partial [candidate division TA06 bacterium]
MNLGGKDVRKRLRDLDDEDIFIKQVSEELRKQGVQEDSIAEAVDRLRDPVVRKEFLRSALKEASDVYAE